MAVEARSPVITSEGRILSPESLSYLALNPLMAVGNLGGEQRRLSVQYFADRRLNDYASDNLAATDLLEVNSAAFALLELGYVAYRPEHEPSAHTTTYYETALAPYVAGARSLFTYATASAKERPERYDDPEFYRAVLAGSALEIATQRYSLSRLQNFNTRQMKLGADCLNLVHAQLDQAVARGASEQIIGNLTGQRAELTVMSLLNRRLGRNTEPTAPLMSLRTFTRHDSSFTVGAINNVWDVSVWDLTRQRESRPQLCLATLPDAKLSITHRQDRKVEQIGGSIIPISLVKDVLQTDDEQEISKLVQAIVGEQKKRKANLSPPMQAFMDACSSRLRTLIQLPTS